MKSRADILNKYVNVDDLIWEFSSVHVFVNEISTPQI